MANRKFTCIALLDDQSTRTIQHLMDELTAKTGSRRAHRFVPHFSLRIDFEVSAAKLPAFEHELESIAARTQAFSLNLTRFGFYDWLVAFLDIDKTPELQALHEAVLEAVQHYRTPWILPELLENEHLTPSQRANVKKYGYHLAGADYHPHITIVGNDLTAPVFESLERELSARPISIQARVSQVALIDRDSPSNHIYKVFDLTST